MKLFIHYRDKVVLYLLFLKCLHFLYVESESSQLLTKEGGLNNCKHNMECSVFLYVMTHGKKAAPVSLKELGFGNLELFLKNF